MAQQRSASARKTAKNPPARRRNAAIKDLPAPKSRTVAGGTDATVPIGTVPTVSPTIQLPATTKALL